MMRYVVASAGAAWLLAWLVLGTDWEGRVDATGRWVDAVSLGRWAVFWGLLGLLGLALAPRLQSTTARVLGLLPTLGFLAVQLWGPLGPIPLVIYLGPTLFTWLAAIAIGRRLRGVARSVKP